MAGPVSIFGRFATAPGFKEVKSVINPFAPKLRRPVASPPPSGFIPANACAFFSAVQCVESAISAPKINNPVVAFFLVNVVDYFGRLFSVMQKPRKAMRKISPAFEDNSSIPIFVFSSGNIAFVDSHSCFNKPAKVTSVRAIAQHFTNFLWNNLGSHLKSPLHLVRGLTAATVSTPIISRSVEYSNG